MMVKKIGIAIMILILLMGVFPTAQAAPKAIIYEMDITASPAVQGRDLPIEIECELGWGGACCYSVYAHDVKAEIFLPENITLISGSKQQVVTSSGQSSGSVAVDPGGGLTWIRHKWTVKAEEYAEYNVTIRVTGRNELGEQINESNSVKISIVSGAAISFPVLPRDPVINKDIAVVVSVTSSDSNVEDVLLYYSKNQENWVPLTMENTVEEVWVGEIPSQNKEGKVYYYLESIDDEGKTFTTEIYSIEVRDTAKIGTIKALTTYGTLVAFTIGVLLIIYIGKRGKIPSLTKGMMILGASLRLSALRELDEIQDDQERLRKIRKWIALILLIAMIIILAVAIITGQLQDVISHTTNPSEA